MVDKRRKIVGDGPKTMEKVAWVVGKSLVLHNKKYE